MHHTSIYFASVADATLAELTAQSDQIIAIQNSHLFPPRDLPLWAVYALGTTVRRQRISTPKTRQIAIPQVSPMEQAALPADNPAVMDLRRMPYFLPREEEIAIEHFQNVGMAQDGWSVLFFGYENDARQMSPTPAPVGDLTVLRATGTTTQTADAWSDITLTYDQQLPVGNYAVVGAQCFAATGIAFRLILDGQYPRPGGLCQLNEGGRPWEGQVMGGLGLWGTFRTVSLPRLQIYSSSADSAQTLWLQVVRMG